MSHGSGKDVYVADIAEGISRPAVDVFDGIVVSQIIWDRMMLMFAVGSFPAFLERFLHPTGAVGSSSRRFKEVFPPGRLSFRNRVIFFKEGCH